MVRGFRFLAVLFCLVVFSPSAFAADSYLVNNGATETIDEHGVCKDVTNNAGGTIMVPCKAPAEWSSFLSHLPPSVTAPDCVAPDPCDGVTCSAGGACIGGYCWHYGESGQNCDAACTGHGGCDLIGTKNYAGSGGTTVNCDSVLDILISPAATPSEISTAIGLGCSLNLLTGLRSRDTTTTTCASSYGFGGRRACACNN